MSIAILFTDTPLDAPKYGSFVDQTQRLLGPQHSYKVYRVKSHLEIPSDLDSLKGVVITGSRSDSFNNSEKWLSLLEDFLKTALGKVPVVGICFGHQVVGKMLHLQASGEENVGRSKQGWEGGITKITTSQAFHTFANEILSGSFPKSFSLVEHHQDAVYSVPEGVENVGSSDKCEIQGLFSKWILTFQGHPEFTTDFYREVLVPMDVAKGREVKEGPENDGELIGSLINGFFDLTR